MFPRESYAGFWRRFIAFSIDATLVSVLTLGVRMWLGANPFAVRLPPQTLVHYLAARIVVPAAAGLIFIVSCWVLSGGRSVGKWLMGIRIVKAGSQPIGIGTAIVRYVGYGISGLFANLGYLLMLVDADKQTLHDKLAKTYVVVDGTRKPAWWTYILGLVGPLILLGMYAWYLMVVHGLVVTVSDVNARYKDFQVVAAANNLRPDIKMHVDKADGYIEEVKAIPADDPNYAQKVRPLARQAVEELKLARDLAPQNALLYAKLNNAYLWLDGEPAAEKAYENAMAAYRIDPKDRHYAYLGGRSLMRLGRYAEAITMLEQAAALDHTYASAYQSLGVSYQALGQKGKAIENYQKAIEFYAKANDKGQNDQTIAAIEGYIHDLSR